MEMEKTSPPPVDLASAEKRVMGDMAFLSKLLSDFIGSAPETLEDLGRCLEDQNGRDLSRGAHQFKGAALNLGLVRVAEHAADLNESGLQGDYPGASRSLSELKQSVLEAKRYLQQESIMDLSGGGE